MSALTSLLARDQIVPLRRIEEVLQKQVTSGGDIAAVLLELDALPENTLAAYSAALFGLLPATRDEVMRAPRDVVRLVPREVAEKHRLVPLGVDGNTLLCALAAPLSPSDEAQLAFLLGHSILARIVCDVRVSAALSHQYGVEPTPRHRRLIERLRERDAGAVPYVAPPPSGKVSTGALSELTQKPRDKSDWLDEGEDDASAPGSPAVLASSPWAKSSPSMPFEGRATSPMGLPRSLPTRSNEPPGSPRLDAAKSMPAAPPEPAEPTAAQRSALPDPHPPERTTFPIGSDRVTDVHAAPPPAKVFSPKGAPAPAAPRPAQDEPPLSGEHRGREALAPIPPASSLSRAAAPRTAAPAPGDASSSSSSSATMSARRHRGPLTPAAAVRLLDEAEGRDGVLEVLFGFARQFFDYSAIFAMHDDHAEGREADGPGASSDEIKRIRVPLDVPNVLLEAKERRAPAVVRLGARDADRALSTQLGRPGAGPALLLPISIKNRVVLVLYADRSGDAFEPSDVPELLALLPRIGAALERIILRKKSRPPVGFEKPTESASDTAVREDLKAAVRGATQAAQSELPKDRRSIDRWAPAERSSVAPKAAGSGWAAGAGAGTGTGAGTGASVGESAGAGASAGVARTNEPAKQSAPPRSLADAALEAPSASPVMRSAAPAAPSPAEVRAALGPRGLLGIPRSAPPPPRTHVPGLESAPFEASAGGDTLPEGILPVLRAPAVARSNLERVSPAAAPPRTADAEESDEPEIEITQGDDEPDVTIDDAGSDEIEDVRESDAAERDARARNRRQGETTTTEDDAAPLDMTTTANAGVATASAYLVRDATVEVVAPKGRKTISSRPPPPMDEPEPQPLTKRRAASDAPRAKRDPRAEDDGAVPDAEVVRMGRNALAQAGPPTSAPRASSPPRAGARDVPSVIVDMGETVSSLVVDLQHAGPDDERALVEALLRLGEAALPVLTQAFPGPLWFDRRRPHRRVPRGRDVSSICRAFFAFGLRATPYVASLVGATSTERRYYALLLAGEMIHPSMLEAVAGRLFDEDDGVRKLAQDVFPRFRGIAGYDEQLVAIRRAARIRGKVPRRRTDALASLAAARDTQALDLCVELLEDEDSNVSRGAHVVLVALTCEDLGPAMRKWAAWVDKNKGRHRIEWLIDALVQNDEALRTSASDELKALTQQYFGFHPSAPRREREVAQSKYRAWWTAEGKKQLG